MMKLPVLQGIIKRRILANYGADPETIQKILPDGFRPKLHNGRAVAGICLIRLEHVRPGFAPEILGMSSENAAHRVAVLWEDENGETKEGVFIPRRDTGSALNHFAGGTVFPGEHHKAHFEVIDDETNIDLAMESDDGEVKVKIIGEVSNRFPSDSMFASVDEASKFFERGSVGYSIKKSGGELDGIELHINDWKVEVLDISRIESSFYNDENAFPEDSITFDHALIMRNVEHEWHGMPAFKLN
jgi:hypothetical protein